MTLRPVNSRLVLYFPGLETLEASSLLGRLKYSAEKTAKIWNFKHTCHAEEDVGSGNCAISTSKTTGNDWEVNTRFVLFDWSDIASSYINTPYPGSLLKYIPGFLAFFLDGTSIRYFKTSKRYWSYTFFPLVFVVSFILISWLLATIMMAFIAPGVTGTVMVLIKIFVVALFTIILCKWPGDRLFLNLTINMSGFSRQMATGESSLMNERAAVFAGILEQEIKAGKYDEIVVVAHSTGVIWAVLALSKALQASPTLLKSTNTTFLAYGSNLPRSALVPRAGYLRDHLQHVMDNPDLFWHEFMTKDDIVSFYKADTMEILGVSNPKAKYVIDCVRFKVAMLPDRYKKMRKSFYRTHKQYILHYDKPVYFDFIMRCFGPFLSRDLALDRNWTEKYFENQNDMDA